MPTATTITAGDVSTAALAHARRVTGMLAEGIAEDSLTTLAGPSKKNAAWLLGHLASTDDYFYTALSGNDSVLPEGFSAPYGGGSEPVDDPSRYPSKAELLAALEKTHNAITDWYKSLSDEQLAAAPPEDLQMFGANIASVATSMAWHEGVHQGQLIEVRHHLGLPRIFG